VFRLLRRGRELDVYDAWSEERSCRCIAKVVRADRLDQRDTRKSLLLEGKLLLSLAHPHIVRAYDLIRGSRPVLVLETLTGATVSKLITDHRGGFPARDVLYLGIHLCSALQYLHGTGYLHLDIKPSNIVAQGGTAKVIDLSLAARAGERHPGTGTGRYMSPEQIEGEPLTTAADVWGLGCVLHEAARGEPAFAHPKRRRYEQLTIRPRRLRRAGRLPVAVADAVDACLDQHPNARPTLTELGAVLRAAV
jgi:serine/threonine protein kinase